MPFLPEEYTSLAVPDPPFSRRENLPNFEKSKIPKHVGIIMDGNGRWAQQRSLLRTDGHRAAEPVVLDIISGAIEAGVRYLSLYTWSTENWKRSPAEVHFLMTFIGELLRRRLNQMNEWGVRVRWSGRHPKLWKSVISELEYAQEATKNNTVIDVVFCINYGGRLEIADAATSIVREIVEKNNKNSASLTITDKMISKHLYNPDIPDVDLVIRTSGEERLSNFLIWEAAYAELDFESTFFPDCNRELLWSAIDKYIRRTRRFGKV